MRCTKSESGFTLIEVIIVATITLLIVSFVISYLLFIEKQRVVSEQEHQQTQRLSTIHNQIFFDLKKSDSIDIISDSLLVITDELRTTEYNFSDVIRRNGRLGHDDFRVKSSRIRLVFDRWKNPFIMIDLTLVKNDKEFEIAIRSRVKKGERHETAR